MEVMWNWIAFLPNWAIFPMILCVYILLTILMKQLTLITWKMSIICSLSTGIPMMIISASIFGYLRF